MYNATSFNLANCFARLLEQESDLYPSFASLDAAGQAPSGTAERIAEGIAAIGSVPLPTAGRALRATKGRQDAALDLLQLQKLVAQEVGEADALDPMGIVRQLGAAEVPKSVEAANAKDMLSMQRMEKESLQGHSQRRPKPHLPNLPLLVQVGSTPTSSAAKLPAPPLEPPPLSVPALQLLPLSSPPHLPSLHLTMTSPMTQSQSNVVLPPTCRTTTLFVAWQNTVSSLKNTVFVVTKRCAKPVPAGRLNVEESEPAAKEATVAEAVSPGTTPTKLVA